MTISQALRQVAELKRKLSDWTGRMQASVVYEETSPPAFQFANVREQMAQIKSELIALQTHIACANATTFVECDGLSVTLAEAIRTLGELKADIALIKSLVVQAQTTTKHEKEHFDVNSSKYTVTTVIKKCELPEAQKASLVDELQAKFNRLNDLVESSNHKTVITV